MKHRSLFDFFGEARRRIDDPESDDDVAESEFAMAYGMASVFVHELDRLAGETGANEDLRRDMVSATRQMRDLLVGAHDARGREIYDVEGRSRAFRDHV
jgi:hypothetical protein